MAILKINFCHKFGPIGFGHILVKWCISVLMHTKYCQGQCNAEEIHNVAIWRNIKIKIKVHSITPSICGGGKEGMRFPRMAAFPLCSSTPRRPQRWWTASPSSCPVWRASALPSFLTSLSPAPCQPPNDSAARGMKAMPCLLQASSAPLIFLS